MALIANPELLILDEPANGLDPAGIHEVRSTIRRLGDEGRTVLLSSHLLHEIEIIADDLIVIGQGRIDDRRSIGGRGRGACSHVNDYRNANNSYCYDQLAFRQWGFDKSRSFFGRDANRGTSGPGRWAGQCAVGAGPGKGR